MSKGLDSSNFIESFAANFSGTNPVVSFAVNSFEKAKDGETDENPFRVPMGMKIG